MPDDILKTKQQFFSDMKEAQLKQAETEVEVAMVQQDAQQELQAEAQQNENINQQLWWNASQSDIDFVKRMMETTPES